MDGILSLFSNPMMMMVIVLILFGGQIKIGDQTLLQWVLSLLSGIFKPVPTPAAKANDGQFGGILDIVTGLFSNPMVLIVGVLAVMMLGGGSCSGCKTTKADAPAVVPDQALPVTPTRYTGPHQFDGQRLQLLRNGGIEQIPITLCADPSPAYEPVWRLPETPADVVPTLGEGNGSYAIYGNHDSHASHSSHACFWQRGPVRRLIAARPLRRLQPLRRVGRALRWLVRR